jgi:hypothetical protein
MKPEEALKRWDVEMAKEPWTRHWSSDEARVFSSGIGRYNDDFRNILPFLPGKSVASLVQLYFTFYNLIQKRDGDALVQLFRFVFQLPSKLPDSYAALSFAQYIN